MSTWSSIQFKFAPFEPLKPPLQGALSILQTVEAILEALIALLKTFLIDFLSPIKALIAILLAAIRTIINQIESSGIAVLLVHPDFSAGDFEATIQSVSGGYTEFETKVVSKFFDNTDIFRPQYPSGSFAGMLVFYIGVESPGDLMAQLMALLSLLRHPKSLTGLPAPVSVKTSPIFKGSDGLAQIVQSFEDTFTQDLDKKISLEWKMPSKPSSAVGPTFVNSLTNFVNSFTFPNFIIERSDFATGEEVLIPIKGLMYGSSVKSTIEKFNFPQPVQKAELKEFNGNAYKHFSDKFKMSTELSLIRGQLSGTYRYVDDDDALVAGKNYWYRIRAYFGDPKDYLDSKTVDDVIKSRLVKYENGIPRINYGKGVVMGDASTPVRGYCPRPNAGVHSFNVYKHVYDAVKAGLLLNFEFPAATGDESEDIVEQKTGWGSLGLLSGQVAPLKGAYSNSSSIRDAVFFKWAARHLSDIVASSSNSKPELLDMMAEKWNDGVAETVHTVLESEFKWGLVGIKSGITPSVVSKINNYLGKESTYKNGGPFDGPYPIKRIKFGKNEVAISKDQRQALANFLRLAIGTSTSSPDYLQWYSLTIGDIFPALTPFLNDFLRFIEDLLKALDSVIKDIIAIIENIISKIQQLENFIVAIIDLIDLLNIEVSVSILFTTGDSSAGLASAIMTSDNKPGSSPFGLHSGIVLCAGGPGPAFLGAFKALGFILGGGWA